MSEFPQIVEKAAELKALAARESHWKRRKPIEALLLIVDRGAETREEVAAAMDVSPGTVDRWLARYAESGILAFAEPGAENPEAAPVSSDANSDAEPNLSDVIAQLDAMRALLASAGTDHEPASRDSPTHQLVPVAVHERRQDEKRVILLGEADDLVASIIEARLEKDGSTVQRATDGVQFAAMAEELNADLFLIDTRLSGLDGYQISRWLREEPRFQSRPIVMLGWPGKETDVVDAFAAGADDYILKPFSPVDLGARVGRLLRPARRAA